MTFWLFFTCQRLQAFSSVPLPSASIMRNTARAAFRNSTLNSSSAAAAARAARRSCSTRSRASEAPVDGLLPAP